MRRALLLGLLPVIATVTSCLGPTEIMVHVTTNACATMTRLDLYVGSASAPTTSVTECPNADTTDLGEIAIVPSDAIDARVDIGVVGAVGSSCSSLDTTDTQCIVAKRSLSFAPHTRLDVPIFLDLACAGIACHAGETCVADPTPHCQSDVCGGDGGLACVVDGGPSVDASPIVDVIGITDTNPTPVCQSPFDGGTPLLSWSFNPSGDALLHEDHNLVTAQQFAGGGLITTPPTFCTSYLTTKSAQTLAPSDKRLNTNSFTIAFAYKATSDSDLLSLQTTGQYGGYTVTLSTGVLKVSFNTTAPTIVYQDTSGTTNDGQWHKFAMHLVGGDANTAVSATFVRDSNAPITKSASYINAGGPLVVGSGIGQVDVDQVEYFSP